MNDLKNSAHVNYDGIREYETDISYFKNLKNAILSDNVNVLKIETDKMKDNMYSELLKAFQSNKNCSFYTDDECDKFIYGKIIALNEDEVAIQMYNTDGTCDGVIVKIVSDFFRIEYDSKYNQKMEKLIETDTFEDSVEIDGNAVFDSAIKSAIIKNFIVSIELLHSGNENITGLPLSLENGICTVRQIDDYGCDDGVTSFVFNTATQITINAKYEKLLSSLMNK